MSAISRVNRPNQSKVKTAPVFFYRVVYEARINGMVLCDAGEVAFTEELCRHAQFADAEAKIASQFKAQDKDGAIVIGAPSPRVLITNWGLLRTEQVPLEVVNAAREAAGRPPVEPPDCFAPDPDGPSVSGEENPHSEAKPSEDAEARSAVAE